MAVSDWLDWGGGQSSLGSACPPPALSPPHLGHASYSGDDAIALHYYMYSVCYWYIPQLRLLWSAASHHTILTKINNDYCTPWSELRWSEEGGGGGGWPQTIHLGLIIDSFMVTLSALFDLSPTNHPPIQGEGENQEDYNLQIM